MTEEAQDIRKFEFDLQSYHFMRDHDTCSEFMYIETNAEWDCVFIVCTSHKIRKRFQIRVEE